MLPSPRSLILLAALALFAPTNLQAQPFIPTSRVLVSNHDFDSATATYCLLDAVSKNGVGNVKTTGSNATLDAVAGTTPFSAASGIAPGSLITVIPGSGASAVPQERYLLTVPSTVQATMNVATDWSGNGAAGFPFTYKNLTCGTGAGAGWFNVADLNTKSIHFWIEQLSLLSGSLAVVIECKGNSPWAAPEKVYPDPADSATTQCHTGLFTTAGATARCVIPLNFPASQCRIGVSLTDDANDLTTNLERFSAELVGQK
jgi:hypothetical protein